MMKLSIVIPVYNAEKYLRKCVESILVNNPMDSDAYEIILVNDRSPDNSLQVMSELYSEHPDIIKIIDSKENLRQGGARNLGMRIAQGAYISFIDSDDYIDISNYIRFVNAHKGEDVIMNGDYFINDEHDESERLNESKLSVYAGNNTIEMRKKLLINASGICNCLYRKDFLSENAIVFPEKILYEDNLFMYMIVLSAKTVRVCNYPFYHYYQQPQSTCNKVDNDYLYDRFKIAEMLAEYFNKVDVAKQFETELKFILTNQIVVIGRMNAVKQCLKPDYKMLLKIKGIIKVQLQDYNKNVYYRTLIGRRNKLLMKIADMSSKLFVVAYKFLNGGARR